MSYTKHTWQAGESVTAEKLNNIETGIESAAEGGNIIEPFIITVTQTGTGISLQEDLRTSAAFTAAMTAALDANKPIIMQYLAKNGSLGYYKPVPYYFAYYNNYNGYKFINPHGSAGASYEVPGIFVDTSLTSARALTSNWNIFDFGSSSDVGWFLKKQTATGHVTWDYVYQVPPPSTGSDGQVLTLHDSDYYSWEDPGSGGNNVGYCWGDGSSDVSDWTSIYWEDVPNDISYDIGAVFDEGISERLLNHLCIYVQGAATSNAEQPFVLKRMYTTYDYDNEEYEPGTCERAVLEFRRAKYDYVNDTITYEKILLFGIMWTYHTIGGVDSSFNLTTDPATYGITNNFFAVYYTDTHYIGGMNSNNILTYSHGGTGTDSLKTLSQKMFKQCAADGTDDLQVLTTYPVNKPGVYRVGQPNITGLPTGISGYGCLVIFNGGSYWLHMYMDMNGGIYFARKDSTAVPTTWYKATTSSVAAKT